MYYITDDGDEYNKSFCKENEFITSYCAGLLQIPSHLFIQSLEPSRFLAIPFQFMMKLFDRHLGWERLGRKMVEALYIKKEQKERQFLLLSAEHRYQLIS